MNTLIHGAVYVLGDNIDTDQILSAEFLKVNPSTAEGYAQLGRAGDVRSAGRGSTVYEC